MSLLANHIPPVFESTPLLTPTQSAPVFASLSNTYNDVSNFVQDINYVGWQDHVKYIFLTLTFIFLFIAIYAYIKAHLILKAHHEHALHAHSGGHSEAHSEGGHGETHQAHQVSSEPVRDDLWENIVQRANSVRDADWKLAVIEGDKFVDDVLKTKGFPGETMGERLMLMKPQEFSSLQDLWDAHKLRNLLVHDTTYQVRHEQALGAIHSFEKVLRELGALH